MAEPRKVAFRDVKQDIRDRILSGRWLPGDLVPSEIDLAQQFSCARATVNRAMRELAEEGLVDRKRKAGTRVRLSPRRQARFEIPIVRNEIEARGAAYSYELITQTKESAPNWLQARMGGAVFDVLHLTCRHMADGNPYQYEDRWINLSALAQAETADFSVQGPNEWLVATVPFSDAEISFSAAPADRDIARALGCAAGDAVFLAERTTWWQTQPITYVRLYHQRGHKMTTRY